MEHLPARTGEARERQLYRGGSESRRTSSGNLREDILDLLPTTAARDYKDGSAPHERNGEVQTDTVARAIFNSGEVLLGTPRATAADSSAVQVSMGAPKGRLEDQVLLPTPDAYSADRGGSQDPDKRRAGGHQVTLADETEKGTTWGKFEQAIRRWERVLDRPAPAPTKPDGKDGAQRLSSKFTEWMMGLPDGWITDAGLTRNEELKACGNGVVPQQAELALRLLLSGMQHDTPKERVDPATDADRV